jgi:hypothetical protein
MNTTLGYERASRWQLAWMRCHWYSMPMSEVRALAAFDLTALSRALAGRS